MHPAVATRLAIPIALFLSCRVSLYAPDDDESLVLALQEAAQYLFGRAIVVMLAFLPLMLAFQSVASATGLAMYHSSALAHLFCRVLQQW